jgi:hypothetical protein
MRGTLEERFWAKVDRLGDDECWPWLAAVHGRGGYGVICSGKRGHKVMAHRVAYELLVGPIPEGLVIDHLCENPLCVNPAHMEPVQNGVNVVRGHSPTALNARKTHCLRGHLLDERNTYRPGNHRYCRTCTRLRKRGAIS